MPDYDSRGLPRRTFLRAAGATAGLLSVGGAAAHPGSGREQTAIDRSFLNWRVLEASKVWERGYRGRADRTVALTDSGVDARHPDLGSWNGISVERGSDGDGYVLQQVTLGDEAREVATLDGSGVIPGGSQTVADETGEDTVSEARLPFDAGEADMVVATLSWDAGASGQDLDFRLEDADGNTVATAATFQGPEKIRAVVVPGESYELVAYTWASGPTTYEISGRTLATGISVEPFDGDPVDDFVRGGVRPDTPSVLGWFGSEEQPLDGNGHGTHVASIMAGSGRASQLDSDAVTVHEPYAELGPGDVLSYDVPTPAGTGLFAGAFGAAIELVVEGPDGRLLDRSTFQEGDPTPHDDRTVFGSNVVVETPAVHDDGTATYTVHVRPMSGQAAAVGRCSTVCVGTFVPHDDTVGDRTEGTGPHDVPAVHSGVAPNAGVLGLQGLGGATTFLAENAPSLAADFNVRAVNMSWGVVGGLPLGAAGSNLPLSDEVVEEVKAISEAGVLVVAAAGNDTTPAQSSYPAVADEAISVVSTGPLDGITDYSSGGLVALDEDEPAVYRKPDVTAPGGASTDLVNAAASGDPDRPAADQSPIRDYVELAGTSMASPFVTGTAALVAEAMEDDAPEAIALPAPGDADVDDVYRLKQVILATASETAFTAAPHHRAHPATYEFGGRDPYEGYGRVNPDAAVDAVGRPLIGDDGTGSHREVLGLDVPADSRAFAGHVVGDGRLTASASFSHYAGGNAAMATDDPHVDLYVYDAANPGTNGEPNLVARAMGLTGTAELSADLSDGVYYVVGKLVNVPGAVTGYDIRAQFDVELSLE